MKYRFIEYDMKINKHVNIVLKSEKKINVLTIAAVDMRNHFKSHVFTIRKHCPYKPVVKFLVEE